MKTVDEAGFRRAIAEFNGGFFFECHDTLEALWVESSGDEKRFLQGLIQVSVGFYHYFNGNPSGALSQWGKGAEKLGGLAPAYGGVDLERLLEEVRAWSAVATGDLSGSGASSEELQRPRLEFNHNTQRR